MTIQVHHLNNSRSQRVLWLLEELELPYEVLRYQRNAKTMLAPPELKRIHPLGKSPVITDGEETIAETGLIIDYIVAKHGDGRLAPARDSAAWWRYAYWLHYAEGSMMTPLLLKLVLGKLGILGWPARKFVDAQLKLHLDYLETQLTDREWFAGSDFSAADIMMSFPLEAAAQRAGLDQSRPHLWRFLQRIHARPAYKRALEKGGPYDFA
ncbi:glutathione S-transferase family protein [Sphingoaurantiacus capsulatus]|uniref:Glutathione S-transferase family protein n=1 Tax=Sphingoaurantiacus capsulatus TaxID=1771310 RepID=A0ABV7X8G3_9SPHN